MSGRGRQPPHPMKPSSFDIPAHYGGGDVRGDEPPPFPPRRPPAPHMIDERMASQHQEIQTLLVDNQHLAATHVALRQELSAVHQDINHTGRAIAAMTAEREHRMAELHNRSVRLDMDMKGADAMNAEILKVRADIQRMEAERQELAANAQALAHDVARSAAEAQQVPAIKQQIEAMKKEIQHARACIEHEKKGYADNYEQGQEMQKNLVSMAREVEKLRAEVANAEKRARAAAAAGNQAAAYGGSYGNPVPEPSYGGNPYPAGYAVNPVPGPGGVGGAGVAAPEGVSQYGTGSAAGPAHWGAYDMQRAPGRR